MLARLTLPCFQIADYTILPDGPALIHQILRRSAAENDIVLSSNGMSAGE